jgi:hypothetical protein
VIDENNEGKVIIEKSNESRGSDESRGDSENKVKVIPLRRKPEKNKEKNKENNKENNIPNKDLINFLESLVQDARAGKIAGVVVVHQNYDYRSFYSLSGLVGGFSMQGALQCVLTEITNINIYACRECNDDDDDDE